MTTERMIRGMNIEARCSPEESMSHAADADGSWNDTGFRLVHDGGDRANRGGNWGDAALHARVADLDISAMAKRYNDLGFRIARDKEAE